MRILLHVVAAAVAAALIAQSGAATPIGNPTKWSQLPDMLHGLNYSSENKVPSLVADDWLCQSIYPVTDIHWWGTYWRPSKPVPPGGAPNSDSLPSQVPGGIAAFSFVIWTDIPAGFEGEPFSHPGGALWEFRVPYELANEVFVGTVPDKQDVYQYFIRLPEEKWFHQEPGTIYWLSIRAVWSEPYSEWPYKQWGWHESLLSEHWNDSAVQDFKNSGWYALNKDGISTDMAFELTCIPEPSSLLAFASGLTGLVGLLIRRRR